MFKNDSFHDSSIFKFEERERESERRASKKKI